MNLALWIGQILLAAMFALSGAMKLSMSRERLLETGQTSARIVPMPLMRFTAVCELLAVLGLILPWLTGVAPVLTPIAAAGLVVVMLGAMSIHARLGEPKAIATNVALLLIAAFVAWGRF